MWIYIILNPFYNKKWIFLRIISINTDIFVLKKFNKQASYSEAVFSLNFCVIFEFT